jgi:hypothetical protein
MGYEFIIDSRVPIVAYDVSFDDLEERQSKAVVYDTIKLASQRLCVDSEIIKYAASHRKRVYSPAFDKEFAVRYSKPKQ